MKRKKHLPRTWSAIYLFFCVGIPFIVFVWFLFHNIHCVREWIHFSRIESVLKNEGIECEGTIISLREVSVGRRSAWKPTMEYLDQHGNKHSFESPRARLWHLEKLNTSISVTFAQNNPSIVLDNRARMELAWSYPIRFIVFTFIVLFSGAFFAGMIFYWRDEYERGLPKAERKRRRRERRLRQREREQRDNVS